MSDDLISREALEAEFRRRADTLDKELGGDLFHISEIVMVIDNAPTVKPQKIVTIPPELIEKLALCVVDTIGNIDWDKAIEAYKARPIGEWIIKSNGTTNYYACNKCGSAGDFQDNFCRVCGNMMKVGADMKGDIE